MSVLSRLFGSNKKAPPEKPPTSPLPDPKIKALVEEYLSRGQAFVWSDDITRLEQEITAQADKALPVIEEVFESRIANDSYQTLQSGTTLVGVIAKITAPETVDLLCRIARRKNASPDYINLITYTCMQKLAEMAAHGRENAQPARDSLAQEFSFLVPKINEYFRKNTQIPPIELSAPLSTSPAPHVWREHCNPKTPKNIVTAFTQFGDPSGKGEAWDFAGLAEFTSKISAADQRYIYWNVGASGVSGIPSRRCYIHAIQVYPLADNLGRMLVSLIKQSPQFMADSIQKLDEPLRQRIKNFVEQDQAAVVNGQFAPQLIADLVAAFGELN